jgi:hypothetical protein
LLSGRAVVGHARLGASIVTVVRVDRFAAFSVNGVGLQRAPFPLSISVAQAEGTWAVRATASRVYDLLDILAPGTDHHAVVLNVGQNSWLNDDYTVWPLARIAQQQGIVFTAHDIRWAATPGSASDDLLVMAWSDLQRFLDGWNLYEVTIIDVASPPGDHELDELALTINTHDHAAPLLPRLPGSRVYFNGHDDCYVYVESVDPVLPGRILARLLTLSAGSALLDDAADTVVVPEPDVSLAAALLDRHPHWAATVLETQPGRTVTMGITAIGRAWRLSDPAPAGTPLVITLDLGTGHWAFPSTILPRTPDPIP